MQDIFSVPNYLQPAKRYLPPEVVVIDKASKRVPPATTLGTSSRCYQKIRKAKGLFVSSSCNILCTTYHASEWFLIYLTLPYLKVVLISSHLTSPLSTTFNHLHVCRRYKTTLPAGPSSSQPYPPFPFPFPFREPPRPDSTSSYIQQQYSKSSDPFCVYVPYLGGSMWKLRLSVYLR